jgi:hypothetical protein
VLIAQKWRYDHNFVSIVRSFRCALPFVDVRQRTTKTTHRLS